MGDVMEKCTVCGEWSFLTMHGNFHVCKPIWDVQEMDKDKPFDDPAEVRASDAEEAAEKWAELEDQGGDYHIVGGNTTTVRVRKQGQENWKYFTVRGEGVPTYYADEIAAPAPEGGE